MKHFLIISLLLMGTTAVASEKTVGEEIGEAARDVKDESVNAYRQTKQVVIETSDEVGEAAKDVYQDIKSGTQSFISDVKKGFNSEKQ